ncbi:MAG TPA: hypothetical protein VHE55_10695 [Fimbriimonadaceae bacterium]|nr:hypothetical protein [Fimbriimonadaceae bacterium]
MLQQRTGPIQARIETPLILVCPYCGETVVQGADRCLRCGWTRGIPKAAEEKVTGPIVSLVITCFVLMVLGGVAYISYGGKYGDEYGYGQNALIGCGICFLTATWLGVGLAMRSGLARRHKIAIFRGSFGLALAFLTLGIVAYLALSGSPQNGWTKIVPLVVAGAGLMLTSLRTLKVRP